MQEMQTTKAADAEAAAKTLQDENAKLRQAAKTNEDRNAELTKTIEELKAQAKQEPVKV